MSRLGDDLHEVAIRVAEVRAAIAVRAGVGLTWLPAGGVGVVRDARLADAGEGGLEFLVTGHERVVVLVDLLIRVEVQGDSVGQRDWREVRDGRVDLKAKDASEELRRGLRVVRGDDGVVEVDGHHWVLSLLVTPGRRGHKTSLPNRTRETNLEDP